MATVLVRLDEWQALTDVQRSSLREATAYPIFGEPAEGTYDGVEYGLFDDPRITVEQVGLLAALLEHVEVLDDDA